MISLENRSEICWQAGSGKLVGSGCEDREPLWNPAGGCRVYTFNRRACALCLWSS